MRTIAAIILALSALCGRAQTTNDLYTGMPMPDMPGVLTNAATNVVNSTNYVSIPPGVKSIEAWFSGRAITNTAAADTNTVALSLSPDASVWTARAAAATVSVVENGTNPVANHISIDVAGARFMKLLQVEQAGTNRFTNSGLQLVPR